MLIESGIPLKGSVTIFTHIPRTAGTALTSSLRQCYGDDRVLYEGTDAYSKFLDLALKSEHLNFYSALCGHVVYGVHEKFLRTPTYIALVRSPVQRFLSVVRFVKSSEGHYLHLALKDMNFDSALDYLVDIGEWRLINRQCEFLCQLDDFRRAKTNVDGKYFLVGPTERFSDFVAILSRTLSPGIAQPQQTNTTVADDGKLSASHVSRLEQLAQEDFLLHEYVTQQFAHICKRNPGKLTGVRLIAQRTLNAVFGS